MEVIRVHGDQNLTFISVDRLSRAVSPLNRESIFLDDIHISGKYIQDQNTPTSDTRDVIYLVTIYGRYINFESRFLTLQIHKKLNKI